MSKESTRPAPASTARATPEYLGHMLMKAATRLRDATAEALQAHGLHPREFGLLNAVVQDPGRTQAELGKSLGIDRTTIVAMLDRLETEGWVERSVDVDDRRIYRIRPTPRGRQTGSRAAAAVLAVEQSFLGPLTNRQADALRGALSALARDHAALRSFTPGKSTGVSKATLT